MTTATGAAADTAEEVKKYEFDADFQSKIMYCMMQSAEFLNRTAAAINPSHFNNQYEAYMVNLVGKHFAKYEAVPSRTAIINTIVADQKAGIVKPEFVDNVKPFIRAVANAEYITDISDYEYIADSVNEFARHQAMENAILKSVSLLERKEYDKVEKLIADASAVGTRSDISNYNFFGAAEIDKREMIRIERLSALSSPLGNVITTGIPGMDNILFHKGWAKKEMYALMGAPKSGKSISLAFFAKNAAISGKNVLFVTLEVSEQVTSERIDSSLTGILMDELAAKSADAKERILDMIAKKKFGKLIIEEFPSGTLTPSALSQVLAKHKVKGNEFDMVVIDYADIMAPNHRYDNPIENSKSVYLDLRAMAQKENLVVLTAMQTNRAGATSAVAKMEHAAEDFNKMRIPDLVISINSTDEEKNAGEARLYFAASRNQVGNITIFIKQDLAVMNFIKSIIEIK